MLIMIKNIYLTNTYLDTTVPLHKPVTNSIFVNTVDELHPASALYLPPVTLTHSMTVKPLWQAVGKLLLD